ncbi:MAG: DHHA1 domain-containing protein [Candidatus Wolfebacteria bacterium]|nr:DHHA1 domain-containing protein [Candidatus Wolfebacteria bacterium]
MNRIIVFYHKRALGPCADGFGAAWVAWKKFGNKAEYIGLENGTEPIFEIKNAEVYFLDIGFREEMMKKLVGQNKKVVFIDHHISRKDYMKFINEGSFSMDNSGSVLAWKYFYPGKKVPKLLRHVEDYDLWKFKLPNTKEIISFLGLYPKDFRRWNKLVSDFENPETAKKHIIAGRTILQYESGIVSALVGNGEEVVFDGHKALAVNSPVLISEIGSYVRDERGIPLAIIWYRTKSVISVSLRSDGSIDCAKLAEKYGGGGHEAASGFTLRIDENFPWKKPKR